MLRLAQLRQQLACYPGFFEVGGRKSSLHLLSTCDLPGQVQGQTVEQDRLVIGRATDAAAADFHAVAGREHYINEADFAQFVEDSARFVAQAAGLGHLVQRFPQHVGQEADEDVSKDAVFLLVPNRANLQVALVEAKGGFRLGQLDVRFPQLLVQSMTLLRSR